MQQTNRITQHPILGELPESRNITIYFNDQAIVAREGDTIAAALTAAGVRVFHHSHRRKEPRGLFCAIGHCTDCVMTVDGIKNVKTCMTLVRPGMHIEGNVKEEAGPAND